MRILTKWNLNKINKNKLKIRKSFSIPNGGGRKELYYHVHLQQLQWSAALQKHNIIYCVKSMKLTQDWFLKQLLHKLHQSCYSRKQKLELSIWHCLKMKTSCQKYNQEKYHCTGKHKKDLFIYRGYTGAINIKKQKGSRKQAYLQRGNGQKVHANVRFSRFCNA